MLDYRSWLGLGDDEEDDPVKKALGMLGQGATAAGQPIPDASPAADPRSADLGPWEQPYPGTVSPIRNPDGSVTTERSITVTEPGLNEGRATNIPTVWSGRVVPDDEAITNAIYAGAGRFPAYASIDDAVAAAEARSGQLGAGQATSIGGAEVPPDVVAGRAAPAAPEDSSFAPPDNPVATGLTNAGRAAVEAYRETGSPLSPWSVPAFAPARAAYIAERALPEIGGEIGAAAGRAAGGPDAAPYFTVPESVPIFGGQDVGPEQVGRFVGSSLTDPLTYVGAAGAAAAGAPARRVVGELARGLPGVGEAELLARGGAGLVRRGLGAVDDWRAGNAERVAAADAGMAAEGSTMAPSATLIVPEGSPVRGRRVRDAPPMDLSEVEAPGFVRAAEELSQGRYGPDAAEALDPAHPLEWHDVTVRINNRGQYDGDHPVSLPFYRNGQGDLIPLEPAEVGPMGSPVNSAYNAAVKAAGGRKGFVYGRWRDGRGVRHEFDSPQEVVAMADLDARLDEGAIDGWWSQANNPYPGLKQIPYASTNRDKGGLKTYVPDLIVRHHDGSLEVIEIKSPEVIAKAEEYGMKAGEVSGHMGWDVVKKAAGIMAGLADQGVRYRLMLPHQVIETGRIPLGPNIAGHGNKSRRLDLLPGVDPRDAPKMRKKTITPAAGSPGVAIARVVDATSSMLMDEAARLKAAGVPDAERLRLLTRMSRDELLPTAELATSAPVPAAAVARGQPPAPTTPGRQEGLTRMLAASGEAPLGSWVGHRGPLGIDDLDEIDPDSARILRDAEQDGGRLAGLAVHDRGDGSSRLLYEIDGDPQAAIRASGRLALHHGADEGSRGIWYRDAKGRYPVGGLDLDLPGGDFEAIRAAISEALPDATMVLPRYNSERVLEGLDLYGRAPDGTPIRDDALLGALLRAQRVLEADGRAARVGPVQRAEMSRFAGEPGHARSPEAAVERAEQILGRRPITVEQAEAERAAKRASAAAQRAADRGGAGRGPAAALGDAAQPAAGAEAEAAGGRLGGPSPLDDVDDLEDLLDEDDLLEASVALLGPYPSARGRGAAGRPPSLPASALTTASQSLVGSMSGGYLGLGAPAESDEERRRNALIGAGLGLVGGPVASRAVARGGARGGARISLGDVPPSRLREPLLPGMEPPAPAPIGEAAEAMRLGPEQRAGASPVVRKVLGAAEERARTLAERGEEPLSPLRWTAEALRNVTYSSLIGPATAVGNVIANVSEPLRALPKELVRAVGRGEPREFSRMFTEGLYGLMGSKGEIVDAIKARGRYAANPDQPSLAERTINPVGHRLAQATEVGGRFFSGLPDAPFQALALRAGRGREASQVATDLGLKGGDWDAYVDRLLADVKAVQGGELPTMPETRRVIDAGESYANRQTFRDELGTIGKKVEAASLHKVPVLGPLVSPFFKTPWNIAVRTAERSPAGWKMNSQASRFDRHYDAIEGSAFLAAMILGPAAAGAITGSGPTDPEKRKMLQREGWQPYSTYVPGAGVYVPNRYFGTYGTLLNLIGDGHDTLAYAKRDEGINGWLAEAAPKLGKNLRQQQYLTPLADILDMLDAPSPGAAIARYAGQTAAKAVPFAATARTIATSRDPSQRQLEGGKQTSFGERAGQAFEQQVGARSALPAAQDVLGQPVENPQQGLWALGPRITTATEDPIVSRFQDAGVDITAPKTSISDDGVTVDLSPEETRRWNELRGEALIKGTQRMIDNGVLDRLPPARAKERLEEARTDAAERADAALRREIGPAEFARRRKAARDAARVAS